MSQEPRSEERSEEANTLVHCHRCGESVTIPSATVATWTADHARQGQCKPLPRSWSLPPEPGPEVTAVRDADGDIWLRTQGQHGGTYWRPAAGSSDPYDDGGTDWDELLVAGRLTDATQDTTP